MKVGKPREIVSPWVVDVVIQEDRPSGLVFLASVSDWARS